MKLVLALLISATLAHAAPKAAPRKPFKPSALDSEFVAACVSAFDRSATDGSTGNGRSICDCAAEERHSQKVSDASLKAETARMRADAKYQFKDKALLASLQACAIQAAQGE